MATLKKGFSYGRRAMEILGIDIGGSGIKGAPVNTETGELTAPRVRIPTPIPAKPRAVAEVVTEIVRHFEWQGPVGCGFPAVVRDGVTLTAANVHPRWIEKKATAMFAQKCNCPVVVVNDADAAGMAEMAFGAGRGQMGVVLMITIGTGLGSALFIDGKLVPNTEFGHLKIRGKDAELRASDAVRQEKLLTWKTWARRFDEFLVTLEKLFWPDLIILGGGVSKKADKFVPLLTVQTKVVPAQLLNDAGIIGAAMAGLEKCKKNKELEG
jgi:polyphosphate glucokinase